MVLLAGPALGHAAACRHPWARQAAGPLRGVSSLLRQQLHPSLGWSLAFVSTNCCSWPLMAAGCWSTHPSEAAATGSAGTAPCLLSSAWTPSESLRGQGCWLAAAMRSRGRCGQRRCTCTCSHGYVFSQVSPGATWGEPAWLVSSAERCTTLPGSVYLLQLLGFFFKFISAVTVIVKNKCMTSSSGDLLYLLVSWLHCSALMSLLFICCSSCKWREPLTTP